MRVLLCALTGMGNHVLEALLSWPGLTELSVLTRREAGRFPHYSCGQLSELCAARGVPCRDALRLDSAEGRAFVADFAPELLLCATFHQRIPAEVLALARRAAINIHPSLLPAHRGPTPTNWAILRGEAETGVSFHELSEGLDEGGIYLQRRLAVGGRTDGELRLALAELAARELPAVLDGVLDGSLRQAPQDASLASWLPNIASEQGLALLLADPPPRERLERGLTPLPGPALLERILAARAKD